MLKIFGLLLLSIGAVAILIGGGLAVLELAGMYSHALSADPLAVPEQSEEETRRNMLRWLVLGAAGMPLFIAGSVMCKAVFLRAMYRKLKGNR